MAGIGIKNCQNCKNQFVIESEDFDFYKTISVPAPTWCPDCRMIRRMLFRNERTWYKTTCAATGKNILSIFAPDKGYTVYDQNYWKSDAWDPFEYGQPVDLLKPFFEQFGELLKVIPHLNLVQKNNVVSDYSNQTLNLKNCYYCAGVDTAEDSAYLFSTTLRATNSFDIHQCIDTERSYELVACVKSNSLRFSQQCEGCVDSWLLFDCRNCQSCVGCVGLRSKQYCIFNQKYTKEDYLKKFAELKLDSYVGFLAAKNQFEALKLKVPRKYAAITKSERAIGDEILYSRNVQGFNIRDDSENVRYSYRVHKSRDIWDALIAWNGAENEYEVMSCAGQNIYFSANIWGGFNVQYSYNCFDCNNLFGCIGLRNKSYCILNKQYSKDEYEQLVLEIITQMRKMGEYGEFFPPELSPFDYNETVAQDYFTLSEAEAKSKGFRWRTAAIKNYQVSVKTEQLPDSIKEANDALVNDVIECAHKGTCNESCSGAFKLIPLELQFYKYAGVPLPRLCPSCRHYSRVKQLTPMKLWQRQCTCNGTNKSQQTTYKNTAKHFHGDLSCPNTFMTPYAPDRKEIIYCETCYQAEIV